MSIVAIQQSSVAFNIDLFSNFKKLIFLSIIKMTFMMMKLSLNYLSCLLYNWQCPWTRWNESCVLIGYPSGQDGLLLPTRGRLLSKLIKWRYFSIFKWKTYTRHYRFLLSQRSKMNSSFWIFIKSEIFLCNKSFIDRASFLRFYGTAIIQLSWPHVGSITHITSTTHF